MNLHCFSFHFFIFFLFFFYSFAMWTYVWHEVCVFLTGYFNSAEQRLSFIGRMLSSSRDCPIILLVASSPYKRQIAQTNPGMLWCYWITPKRYEDVVLERLSDWRDLFIPLLGRNNGSLTSLIRLELRRLKAEIGHCLEAHYASTCPCCAF